jgi:hypothetical protein
MNRAFFSSSHSVRLSLVLALSAQLAACGHADATASGSSSPPQPSAIDDDVVAVFMLDGVHFIAHDGSERVALAGDPLLAEVTGGDLLVNGGYVFVTAQADNAPAQEREALLTADGSVLWKRTLATWPQATQEPWLAENGSLVRPTDAGATIVRTDGTSVALTGFVPIGALTTDGFLAVGSPLATLEAQNFKLTASNYGWWKIGDSSPRALAFDPIEPPTIAGRTLLYAPQAGPATRLVLETPEDVRTLDLPSATEGLFAPEQMGGTEWLLMADSTPDAVWRIDLTHATSERLSLTAPAGFSAFPTCGAFANLATSVSIGPDGSLVARLRTADRAAFFVSSDGAHWSQIGEAATSIGSLDVRVAGETFAVLASQEVPCYTAGPSWAVPTTPALLPEAAQLVRLADSASFVRGDDSAQPVFSAALSRSGRYAAFWVFKNGKGALHLVDIVADTEQVVLADSTGHASAPHWVAPRPGP